MGVPLEEMDAVFGEGEFVPQNRQERGLIFFQRKDLTTSPSALPLCRVPIPIGCQLALADDTILQREDGSVDSFTATTGAHIAPLGVTRNRNSRGWMVSRQWRKKNYVQSSDHPLRQGARTQLVKMLYELYGHSFAVSAPCAVISQYQGLTMRGWCELLTSFLPTSLGTHLPSSRLTMIGCTSIQL